MLFSVRHVNYLLLAHSDHVGHLAREITRDSVLAEAAVCTSPGLPHVRSLPLQTKRMPLAWLGANQAGGHWLLIGLKCQSLKEWLGTMWHGLPAPCWRLRCGKLF